MEEIPIPEIRKVTTYEQDYRPNFSLPVTYLRSRTFGRPLGDAVEYDLDNDDEDWLEKYNDGQNRLPAEKFEVMIWKLEVSCGEANDAQMAITAAAATERGQIISYQDKCAAMAGTDALPKEKALELLKEVSGRPAILEAVYVYWCEKRKRTGKPCLRRLQPPPRQTTPTLSMSSASARRRTVRRRGAVARTTRRRSKRCARSDATWRWRTPSWSCSCVAKRRSWSARGASATRRRCRSSFDTSPGRCTRRSRRSTRRSRRRARSRPRSSSGTRRER